VLDRLCAVRVVSWEWNEQAIPFGRREGERCIGVIAQELETIFPELVKMGEDGYRRVDYAGLAALAILGVQELHAELLRLSDALERLAPPAASDYRASASK
jgi:hypothetical protein